MTKRLRLFLFRRDGRTPASGTPVTLVSTLADGSREVVLGTLASDANGYVSFKIAVDDRSAAALETSKLTLRPFARDNEAIDVSRFLSESRAEFAATVTVSDGFIEEPRARLPSVQDAEIADWKVSPSSFTSPPGHWVANGGGGELRSSRIPDRKFRFVQLIRDLAVQDEALSPAPVSPCQPTPLVLIGPPACIRRGRLHHYQMIWHPIGHGIGELSYSLPLAPCESVNIVVADWGRQDAAQRTEEGTVTEQLDHEQQHDRLIEESVQAMVKERQHGGSILGGGAVAGARDGGIFEGVSSILSGALSIGGGFSTTSGSRRVTADTTQDISDAVRQHTAVRRDLQSTVILQASQSESDRVTTRTVRNPNGCHALTILYHQVVRHYIVRTEWSRTDPVVLFRQELISFDRDAIYRWRDVLRGAIIDSSLVAGLLALEKLRAAELSIDTAATTSTFENRELSPSGTGIRLRISTGTTRMDRSLQVHIVRRLAPSPIPLDTRYTLFSGSETIAQGAIPAESWVAGIASANDSFESNGECSFTVHPRRPVRWGDVGAIVLRTSDQIAGWDLGGITATVEEGDISWTLLDHNQPIHFGSDQEEAFEVQRPGGARSAETALTSEERYAITALEEHLRAHAFRYSQLIWLARTPDEWTRKFEGFLAPDGLQATLADVLEPYPVGTSGSYVAFRFTGGDADDAPGSDSPGAVEELVSIPTRGLFAEAMLSQSNACEEVDITRVSGVKDGPCGCSEAPPIQEVPLGSRAISPDVSPTAMPAPVVNIVNPPATPDPGAMSGALQLLGTSNIFRDMAVAEPVAGLLGQLSTGTISLAEAQLKARQITSAKELSKTGGVASPKPTPQEQMAQLSVYRNAAANGELSKEQQGQLSREYLRKAQYETASPDSGSGASVPMTDVSSTSAVIGDVLYGRIVFGNFEVDSADLTDEHRAGLTQFLTAASSSEEYAIESIEGRASQTGPEANNDDLSRRRASAVATYLEAGGVPSSSIGSVSGVGSSSPFINRPGSEVDVNRSAMLTYRIKVEAPPRRRQTADSDTPSDRWALAVYLSGGAGHGVIGGSFLQGELMNMTSRQKKMGFFIGGGLGAGLSTPGADPFPNWVEFRTRQPCVFADFDGTAAFLWQAGAGFLVGYSVGVLSFPELGAEDVFVGGLQFGSVGADASINFAGWWVLV